MAIGEITPTPAVVDLPLNVTVQLADRGGNIVQDIAWRVSLLSKRSSVIREQRVSFISLL